MQMNRKEMTRQRFMKMTKLIYLGLTVTFLTSVYALAIPEHCDRPESDNDPYCWQGKLAVLVIGADNYGTINQATKELERQAILAYTKLHFKIEILGGAQARKSAITKADLQSVLKGYSGVQDLRLDFIGHGGLTADPTYTRGGSPVSISIARRSILDEDVKKMPSFAWVADDSTSYDNVHPELSMIFGIKSNANLLTQSQIRQVLAGFRHQNPQAITVLNFLNCYSGAVAQELRHEPNTIVFANSPAFEPAIIHNSSSTDDLKGDQRIKEIFEKGLDKLFLKSANGPGFYYQYLLDGSASGSLDEARFLANRTFRSELEKNIVEKNLGTADAIYQTGRSPVTEDILGWCESTPPASAGASIPINQEARSYFERAAKELEEIEGQFNRVSQSGNTMEITKREFDQCESTRSKASSAEPITHNDPTNWPAPTTQLAHQYIEKAFEQMLKTLDDPSQLAAIRTRLLESLANVESLAKVIGVDASRGGTLIKMKSDLEAGTMTDAQLGLTLDRYFRSAMQDCKGPNVNEPPCSDHVQSFATVDYLIYGLPSREFFKTQNSCENSRNRFECMKSQGQPWRSGLFLGWWYDNKEAQIAENAHKEDYCLKKTYPELLRTRANLELDQACLARFEKQASAEEWQNLLRLGQLGSRPAKGE